MDSGDITRPLPEQFAKAAISCASCITRGPVVDCRLDASILTVHIAHGLKEGYTECLPASSVLLLRTGFGSFPFSCAFEPDCERQPGDMVCSIDISDFLRGEEKAVLVELYDTLPEPERLTAISNAAFPVKL